MGEELNMSSYLMPEKIKNLQLRVRSEVNEYFEKHQPEESVLVLDSTGPMATRHYLVLNAIGREKLLRFKEIHAFSGGAFAIFGFLGLTSNNANYEFSELRSNKTERLFRSYHHPRKLSVLRVLLNLARRKSAFESNSPVHAMINHIFRPEYLEQPFQQFPANVIIYLGQRSTPAIVCLSNGPNCDTVCRPLLEQPLKNAIVSAVTVPMVYGRKDGQDAFFDAVYAGGYSRILKTACQSGAPTLVSTPWRSGQKDKIQFLNCFPTANQKAEMFKDFGLLLFNIPNRSWGDDIYAAFES
jgi:hypothetical protein